MSLPNYFSLLKDKKCLCPTIFPYLQLKFVLCKTKCKVANFCISEVIFCWRKKRKIKCPKTNFKVHIFCLLHILFCCKKKTKNVFPNVFNNGVSYFFLECRHYRMVFVYFKLSVPYLQFLHREVEDHSEKFLRFFSKNFV